MDIQKEYEQELIFQIELEDSKMEKKIKKKGIIRKAGENLTKMMMDRLNSRTGEC